MVLVCVTDQETCSRLIYTGRELADLENIPLKVICVRPRKTARWLASDEVEFLFNLSKQLGAEMVIIFHDSAVEAVADYIHHHDTHYVLVGSPPQPGQSIFISEIEENFPDIPVITVDQHGTLQRVPDLDPDQETWPA